MGAVALVPVMTQQQTIFAMAAERDDGASVRALKELHGIPKTSTSRHIVPMLRAGKVFASTRPGCRRRWFATQARADAWAAMPAMVPSEWHEAAVKAWSEHPERHRKPPKVIKPPKAIKPAVIKPAVIKPAIKAAPIIVKAPEPPKFTAGPSKIVKRREPAAVDYSRAKWTRDVEVRPVARWQSQPDSGVSIFADMPRYGGGS